MLNPSMFTLTPGHVHPQKIHILIDTGYIHSINQQVTFLSQLTILEKFIFKKSYSQHVHVRFYYFNKFHIQVIDNKVDDSLQPLLSAKGLPKLTEAIELMSKNIDKEKDSVFTKPWLFFFIHGFSIQNGSMPLFETLLKQSLIFCRGFLLSTTVRLDRFHELQPKPPILKVLEDKIEYPLAFIFQQAKLRVEAPIQQIVGLPSADFFKIWSTPLGK